MNKPGQGNNNMNIWMKYQVTILLFLWHGISITGKYNNNIATVLLFLWPGISITGKCNNNIATVLLLLYPEILANVIFIHAIK
jgi:hypothetical protein